MSSDEKTPLPQFIIPAGQNYTCHGTGECCNQFTFIPVDEDARGIIDGLDSASLNSSAGNPADDPLIIYTAEDGWQMRRRQDKSCCMLHDKLCTIHRMEGSESKPQACRDFPYRFVDTPGGTYVGVSFVCSSVRKNLGQPLVDQQGILEEVFPRSTGKRSATRVLGMNRRVEMGWDEYLLLEDAFDELLSSREEDISVRLIACCILINFLERYLATLEERPIVEPGHRFPPGAVAHFIADLQSEKYENLLRVARKPLQGPGAVKRMFLGMVVEFANTLQKSRGRIGTLSQVMSNYLRYATGLGGLQLRPMHARLRRRDLDGAGLPSSGDPGELVERYLRHAIQRKDLLLGPNVERRLKQLMINAALIPWYAIAHAKSAGRPQPEMVDWEQGVLQVERLLGYHSRLFGFFERNQLFDDIVESFLLKPRFPYVILGRQESAAV